MFKFLGDLGGSIWDGVSGLFGGGGVGSDLDSLISDRSDLFGNIADTSSSFQWKDYLVPGLTAATQLAVSLPQAQQAKRQDALAAEQLAYNREQAEADRAFQLGKLLLDAQFKGGGGGGGGARVPITTGIDVANVISGNVPARQRAIEALMQGLSSPLNGSNSGRI